MNLLWRGRVTRTVAVWSDPVVVALVVIFAVVFLQWWFS